MPIQILVFATIAASTLAWAASETTAMPWARRSYTLGAVLMLVHAIAAFEWFYLGSHEVALAETAHQTRVRAGVDFAGGLYLNYLFILIWIGDAVWWWLAPAGRAARPRALALTTRGLFFFMFINGAVIFADGGMRLLGLAAVTAVAVAWYREATARR